MSTLSPSAQKIQNLFNELGYNYTVIEHAEPVLVRGSVASARVADASL